MASPSAGAPSLKYGDVNPVTPSPGEVKGLISGKILAVLILDKSSKYDPSSINQLPFETFEVFKIFLIYFNKKHGNISYSNEKKYCQYKDII